MPPFLQDSSAWLWLRSWIASIPLGRCEKWLQNISLSSSSLSSSRRWLVAQELASLSQYFPLVRAGQSISGMTAPLLKGRGILCMAGLARLDHIQTELTARNMGCFLSLLEIKCLQCSYLCSHPLYPRSHHQIFVESMKTVQPIQVSVSLAILPACFSRRLVI